MLAAIALGAAFGAPARYGIAQVIRADANAFPWATFWTNVSGSLALGLFLTLILERFPPSRYLRPFVATGFIGAYTTYSTWANDSINLWRSGRPHGLPLNLVGSVIPGVALASLGLAVGSRL